MDTSRLEEGGDLPLPGYLLFVPAFGGPTMAFHSCSCSLFGVRVQFPAALPEAGLACQQEPGGAPRRSESTFAGPSFELLRDLQQLGCSFC